MYVHIRNIRDYPQAKFDREINVCFLHNEHSDLHFLFHNFNKNNITEKRLAEIYG